MAIAETFLSAFLQVLFEQLLTTGGTQFLKLIGGVDLPKTIKKWKIQLTRLEALLDDAELQQFHSKPVKLWLNDLQDLAYDIEDILDHFAIEAQRYQLKQAEEDQANALDDHSIAGILNNMAQTIRASSSRAANSLSTLLKPIDQDIQDKIDDITERLQDIQDQTHSLTLTAAHMLQQQILQTESLRSQRESTSLVGNVFGRDEKKKEIITLLLKHDQSGEGYVVIPIVGTGGIGKTTLAQYVYNDEQKYVYRDEQLYVYSDEQQKCNFDLKAWVCVSDVFDVKCVTIDIINSASQSNFDCSNLDQAHVKLQKVLKGKKFFIVLDDIWSEEYDDWYKLQEPFRHGAKGSRVVMTTRIESIAMMMVNNPTQRNIIKLESLSNDDCWLIFQQHANVDSDLAEMRDNIIEKINGLPLAAKALGGLLKSIPDKSQHQKILESNVWGEKSSVLPVLRLSYHHMPSHLKRVFAYCSIFPKDYKFKEMKIVLLWMAQGFIQETQIETMEDMGQKYFNDLVSRSLFEKSPYGEGEFIMHDLIHDMAQLAACGICYVMDVVDTQRNLGRTRHLFITEHVQTLRNQIMVPQLRTFLCSYCLIIDNLEFIQRMQYVRSLYLVSEKIEVLPDCIGDLKHLRYLSLKFKRMKVLPQSINNLWNLQTLCLEGCYKAVKIPCIESLGKLRHLNIDDISLKEMPLGIGKLTNLQTLNTFVLAVGGGSRVRELGKLNQLHGRLLIVSGLENVTEVEDAEEAQFCKKKNLDGLNLKWGTCTNDVDDKTRRDVVGKLRPHTSIKECELVGYMGSRFPSWLGDPSFINMVDIKLKKCLKCVCLPPLGKLRSLKSLLVEDMDGIQEVGLEFYGNWSTPFSSLKTLQFSHMKSWEKWVHPTDNNNAFPILEELSIKDCSSLQGDIPPYLPSLRTLDIKEYMQLQSLELKILSSSTSRLDTIDSRSRVRELGKLKNLCGTYIVDVDDKTKRDVVEKLQPYTSIKEFRLDGYIGSAFPSWLGDPSFNNMAHIRLNNCVKCEWLPPLGQLPSLKSLRIEHINGIKEVGLEFYGHCSTPFPSLKTLLISGLEVWEKWMHPLVGINKAFPVLEELSIDYCLILKGNLPPHLPSLRTLDINACRKLQSLELKNSSSSASRLASLSVEYCESMVSIDHIPLTLQLLYINCCEKLGSVEFDEQPTNLSPRSEDGNTPKSEENIGVFLKASLELPLLTSLKIESCPSLRSLQQNLLLPALQTLELWDCKSMERLPGQLLNFTSLERLYILECPKIHSLAEGGLPRNLVFLEIEEVNIKQAVTEWKLHLLHSLKALTLKNVGSSADSVDCILCPHLSLPSSLCLLEIRGFQYLRIISNGNTLPNLTRLDVVDCPRLESLVSNFTSLTDLITENCPKFHNFPEEGLPTNLRSLSISDTNTDKPIKEWGLHRLTSLHSIFLTLVNVSSSLDCISDSDLPSSLRTLHIKGFQNLKTICCSTLPELSSISVLSCPRFESFGDHGLPPSIESIYIKECEMIQQHLRSDPGGRILTENGRFSLPLSETQPSSAHSSDNHIGSTLLVLQKASPSSDIHSRTTVITALQDNQIPGKMF
uniref:Uncharacterized protein n=1 Tax=Chenopodium quinoa TaxID=63459 RepID=A0A803MMY7_CHEQI